jgi:hypothetical protein
MALSSPVPLREPQTLQREFRAIYRNAPDINVTVDKPKFGAGNFEYGFKTMEIV